MARFRRRRRTVMGGAGQSWGFYWQPGPEVIADSIERYEAGVSIEVGLILSSYASVMKAHAKANHRWANRTGEAERQLDATVVETRGGNGYRLILWGGVPYQVFLEAREDLAVIGPTIDLFAPSVIADLRKVV